MTRTSRTSLSIFAVAIAGLLALFPALTARAQVVGGTISGTVTDSTGAAVANADVLVHNDETGNERRLKTGADGRYNAPSVPVGSYTVSVKADGFADRSRSGIALSVGQSQNVPVSLSLAGITQTVTVKDDPPIINTSTQQTAGLVDERQVKELPLNGRSYDQLITLNPATVNYTAQRSGTIGTSNSSVGNMFAVSGRRPQDNLFLLNGVEYTGASLINVTPGGTSGQLLGVEAVREFNVISDTYSASYGKRQGAQVSIVTAGGTNQIHGSAYEFLRNSFFDARNYFDPARIPEFQRNNFGASLGGPIKKDKLFLFGNYEGYRQNLGVTDVTYVPDNNARNGIVPGVANPIVISSTVAGLLNLWPVQNGPEIGGGIAEAFSSPAQHIREDFGTARFDANLTPNDLLFGVFTIDDSIAATPSANPFSLVNESLREQVWSVQEQHVFSPRLLNTARAGFSRANFYFLGSVPSAIQAVTPTFLPGKPTGAVVIAGSTASNGASSITTAGVNVGSNNGTTRNLFTFDDHIFYTRGKQQIEAGAWVQLFESNDNLAQDQDGQASFGSLALFLQGTIKTFTYVPQTTELGWRSTFVAGYLEDTVKLLPNLEFRAGIRSESTDGFNASHGRAGVYGFSNGVINTTPTTGSAALAINRALFLPEPRLGVSYSPFESGKTAIRASFGLQHALLDTLDYRLDQSGPFNTVIATSGSVTNPTSGTASVSPSTVQPDISTPSVLAWTLRVEQQVAPNTSLTLGYVGSHGYHQILSEDLNEPASVVCPAAACLASLPAGTIYYPTTTKPNPALVNTTSWVSQGSSSYNALEVDLRRNLAQGFQLRANYTYARNLDDGSAWNTSVSANTPAFVAYPNKPSLDWGPAATDIRHQAAINASYDLPLGNGHRFLAGLNPAANKLVSGITLSAIATLESGFPFSPQLGYNPTGSGDSRNPVRPNINPNFSGSRYTQGTTAQRVAQYFNPAAFSAPAYGTVGNASRDLLTGPGYNDLDLSLTKSTQITERVRAQFRAEFFNILNHTNLGTPSESVFTAGPTQGNAASQNTVAAPSLTAGGITTAATTRQIQLGVKLLF
jgi:hypothetical protein